MTTIEKRRIQQNIRQKRYAARHPDRVKKTRDASNKRLVEYKKEWYIKNKVRQNEKRKIYMSNPEVRERSRQRGHRHYEANKEKYIARRQKIRNKLCEARKKVVFHYGCKNPKCMWKGDFLSGQLEFHHFDPNTKNVIKKNKIQKEKIAQLTSMKQFVQSINKCVVLCANCHFAIHNNGDVPIDSSMICKTSIAENGEIHID